MDYAIGLINLGMFYMKLVSMVFLAAIVLVLFIKLGFRIWEYIEDKKWQKENTESK